MDHGFSRMRRLKRGFFRGDPLHQYVPWRAGLPNAPTGGWSGKEGNHLAVFLKKYHS
jgi:hypothetical protein